MTYQSTEVYRYLVFLQKYLLNDLELFHQLSSKAEHLEKRMVVRSRSSLVKRIIELFSKNFSEPVITTTKYPYGFEFMFGRPIIARSTIPHTATLFSTIDILGYLVRSGQDFTSTKKNFESFFESITNPIASIELAILTKVYRHGMTHSYFPKLNVEISYHSSNPTGKLFFKNQSGDLVLNVNLLESIVTNQLENLINRSDAYDHMEDQFRSMIQKYEDDSRTDIEELKSQLS